ncbi:MULTISPECIES: benzoate 1,2-dioxygenase small subunit [unclassified Oceanobacter]|jgi:benzoate/toluate 1,2-dioxygenase beta subunit|uniref:benzoate 1,2-dioxygenase small subunit n=1 Tax=unclassified Oceanobacter TaxID=2620260 RepID=UPI0026E245A5|nr:MULTISPECIES: benzoate 1,2-dioxygenase small subunit [unclassified Oceanobacter]MDO6682665.1 benzoate 1,2-dioxygenase small subunit [Oceanobacter sp. 5_MG-2023]MDP2505832.1 benzoate 1,2-dioxygenase small subunit [Oceanobacter sp. 3_MG-2023]MDP2548427.1 benzoate 1,2-dioxygenase small subunit [Oceanobacter sp. 4_MG-2023]MDP2609126.1 benzoate 1,2-dioxygenase small subunit [Oceanobacter sp. 1_MG-2023]MDP2612448.1 benzoate 1,2-dioxygenase small subunit [Oceanobacter sp. 2_MG-2023]
MSFDYQQILNFLYSEARALDDKQWDQWLEHYDPEAEFWIPSWDDDGELVTDPQAHVSLMYYRRRDGLEDRVFRIKTERSSASSLPEPRTSHNTSNVEIVADHGDRCEIRYNWCTHSMRYHTVDSYFGNAFVTLIKTEAGLKILQKTVVIKNDYIHHVVDIYHV